MSDVQRLGVGVLIRRLAGNKESTDTFAEAIGKTIAEVKMKDDALLFRFADGFGMKLSDNGQSCCESRYMTCGDDLSTYAGATLLGGEVAPAPDVQHEYASHEVQFLRIQTSAGAIVCETHVEHNGYYGGFAVEAEKLP